MNDENLTNLEKLENTIDTFGELKGQADTLKKKIDPMNTDIKLQMKALGKNLIETERYTAAYSTQDRTSMDSKMLMDKLKALNLTQAIDTIEVVNEEKVQDLIYKGLLHESQLADCVKVNVVEVLKVSAKKQKKGVK